MSVWPTVALGDIFEIAEAAHHVQSMISSQTIPQGLTGS